MKEQQQQQARQMYFQSDLSKTEIAGQLNVDRLTVYQWSIDGDWDKLKTSAKNMPAILAEKCYYLLGHFTDNLLSKDSFYQSITKSDVDIIYKLAKTIKLLKRGNTVNEDMETFTWFLEGLQKRDAQLADALVPYANSFMSCRTATDPSSFVLSGYDANGFKSFSEKEIMEKWQDEKDAEALLKEREEAQRSAKGNTGDNTDESGLPENEPPVKPTDVPPVAKTHSQLKAEHAKQRSILFWENQAKAKARKDAQKNEKAAAQSR